MKKFEKVKNIHFVGIGGAGIGAAGAGAAGIPGCAGAGWGGGAGCMSFSSYLFAPTTYLGNHFP